MQVNVHERSSKENLLLNILVIMDRQIINYELLLSPKHCVDLLFAREICCAIVSNISRTHDGLHSQVDCLN